MRLQIAGDAEDSASAVGIAASIGVAGLAIAGAGIAGLLVQPRPFPEFAQASRPPFAHVPIPEGLPDPVARWLNGMWAELAAAAPATLATDARVSWQPLDEQTTQLVVPLGADKRDSLIVRFDPDTGALRSLEAQRYRSSADPDPILWIARSVPGSTVGEFGLPSVGTATWSDQGTPWAVFTTEDIRTDVDVSEYVRGRGT